jgi:Co/Zn/Cd efflux system component
VLSVSGSSAPVLHRHGRRLHEHPHAHAHRHLWLIQRSQPVERSADHHEHEHHHHGEHGHSHGLVDRSILRSRAGFKAVSISLGVLGAAALVQAGILVLTGSVALLADLIHNVGDALTAVPVGIAFLLRSFRAEKIAGLAVVLAIFVSACVALYESIARLIHPQELSHLWVLAAAGLVGFVGNELAAQVRLRAGRRLSSPALIADGNHARVDGFVSLGVVASALVVALGAPIGDPIIGLLITAVILKITWDSWRTVSTTKPGELVDQPRTSPRPAAGVLAPLRRRRCGRSGRGRGHTRT